MTDWPVCPKCGVKHDPGWDIPHKPDPPTDSPAMQAALARLRVVQAERTRQCSACGRPRAQCRPLNSPFLSCCPRCAASDGDLHGQTSDVPKDTAPSLIEVITEAYHVARCSWPDTCPAKCPHRMPTDLANAVHSAVVAYQGVRQ